MGNIKTSLVIDEELHSDVKIFVIRNKNKYNSVNDLIIKLLEGVVSGSKD